MQTETMTGLLAPFLGGTRLNPVQLAQFSSYLDLLLLWNARMNLTAVRAPEHIVGRHFGESLFAARSLYPVGEEVTPNHWLLDLGSGAGFPGLPIKIWVPGLRLVLIESQHRKATFLREAIRALGLAQAEVLPIRAEDFSWGAVTGKPGQVTVSLRAVERFERVLPVAARLLAFSGADQRRLALLTGAGQASAARQLLPELHWSEPLPSPESRNRVLLVAHQPAPATE